MGNTRHGSGMHVPSIFVGAPLNHCKICSTVSATAATPLENKEGLIISDGNSRINNRGLARRSRRGLLERAPEKTEGAGRRGRVVEESNEGAKGWGDAVVAVKEEKEVGT